MPKDGSKLAEDRLPENLCYEDKWILSKLNKLVKDILDIAIINTL